MACPRRLGTGDSWPGSVPGGLPSPPAGRAAPYGPGDAVERAKHDRRNTSSYVPASKSHEIRASLSRHSLITTAWASSEPEPECHLSWPAEVSLSLAEHSEEGVLSVENWAEPWRRYQMGGTSVNVTAPVITCRRTGCTRGLSDRPPDTNGRVRADHETRKAGDSRATSGSSGAHCLRSSPGVRKLLITSQWPTVPRVKCAVYPRTLMDSQRLASPRIIP